MRESKLKWGKNFGRDEKSCLLSTEKNAAVNVNQTIVIRYQVYVMSV